MASDPVNSILQSHNPDHLKQFNWDMLLDELSTHAPQLLFSAAKTKIPRSNTNAVVGRGGSSGGLWGLEHPPGLKNSYLSPMSV